MLDTINGCVNPFSDKYYETVKQFAWLNTAQKICTIFMSIAAFLITLPLFGIGGYATFYFFVKLFTPKSGEDSFFDKVNTVSGSMFQIPRQKLTQARRIENGGIPNIGNTCFMNSSLQLILNSGLSRLIDKSIEYPVWNQFSRISLDGDQLSDYVAQFISDPEEIENEELKDSLSKFLTALDYHNKVLKHQTAIQAFRDVYEGKNKDLSLRQAVINLRSVFVDPLTRIVALPNSFSQQDAAEFMSAALPSIGYQIQLKNSTVSADENVRTEETLEEKYLSISIVEEEGNKNPSIQHLINCFQSEYINDPDNAWVDQDGVRHEQYWKHCTIVEEIPEVIVIQLKRFTQIGQRLFKNEQSIRIDEEVDLTSIIDAALLNEGDSVRYRITGIINHSGSLNGGHYTATVKTKDGWECRSDTSVNKINSRQVCSDRETGYMFVLERIL